MVHHASKLYSFDSSSEVLQLDQVLLAYICLCENVLVNLALDMRWFQVFDF